MDEDSLFRHKDERKVRVADEYTTSLAESTATDSDTSMDMKDSDSDHNSDQQDSDEEDEYKSETNLDNITEENDDERSACDMVNEEERTDSPDTSLHQGETCDIVKEKVMADPLQFPDTSLQLQHVAGDKSVTILCIQQIIHIPQSQS